MKRKKVGAFFLTSAFGSAALCEVILHPITMADGCIIAALSALLWLMPWRKFTVLRRIITVMAAGILFYDGVVIMTRTTADGLPWWVWCAAFVSGAAVLCYCGEKAVRAGGTVIGMVLTGLLTAAFLCCLPMYSAPIDWRIGGLQNVPFGVITTVGSGLTAVEFTDEYNAVRWGGLTSCLVRFGGTVTIFGVWSGTAVAKLSLPLISAWQRIDISVVFSCPNELIAAWLGAACVWQIGAVAVVLYRRLFERIKVASLQN